MYGKSKMIYPDGDAPLFRVKHPSAPDVQYLITEGSRIYGFLKTKEGGWVDYPVEEKPVTGDISKMWSWLREGWIEINPCGHPVSSVVSSDEGTCYCGDCAMEEGHDV